MIEIRNFSMGYGSRVLIADADATFRNGEMTALIGRNGSGKSTLLRALAGLNLSYSGSIAIDGDSKIIGTPERARRLAFVNTSRVRISNMLCRDIVALGRAPYTNWIGRMRPEDESIVMKSLATVGMESYAGRTLDTMSDGECQRVMVARALAQDTPTILLDEPTSFLDLPNRYQLMRLLGELAHEHGKCVVLSTHELDIALHTADRIALIDNGRLEMLDASAASAREVISSAFGIEI